MVRLFTISGEFDTSGQTSLKAVRKRGCSTARRGGAKRRKNSPQATVFSQSGEQSDSVKKESKTSVFDSFLYIFWHF